MAGSGEPLFQFEWEKGADVPCDITWCRTVVAGEVAYVSDFSGGVKVFSYDPKDDLWEFLSETVSPPTVFFGLGSFRDSLMFVGGKDAQTNESSKTVTQWVPSEKRYSNPFPPMLFPRVDPQVVGWGDYLIVAGGITAGDNSKQSVEIFNGNAWKIVGDLPVSTPLSTTVIDKVLYLLGDNNKLYKASLPNLTSGGDPSAVWELVTSTPTNDPALFSFNGHLLIAGGTRTECDMPNSVTNIMLLNQDTQWVQVGDLPYPCCCSCCISVPKDEAVFLMAGKSNKSDSLLLKGVYRAFRPIKN